MSITITKQVRDFSDLDFAFTQHPITNSVPVKKNINAIKQSVVNLLSLREGDKPYHPEIVSPIWSYLFENFTAVSVNLLETEIKRYLNAYEPRIVINYIRISQPSPNDMNCEITGTVINLDEPFTVNVLVNRLR